MCTTGGCEVVQSSEYAKVAGVPVALVGLVGYLALLATALSRAPEAAAVAVALALGGLGFAAYLLYVQLAVLDAVCIWCVASDVVMALLATAAGWRLWLLARAGAPTAG